MTYEELLRQPPYQIEQKQKELWYVQMLSELTRKHRRACPMYGRMLDALGIPKSIKKVENIPMMPVSAFKEYKLRSIGKDQIFKVLTSSGTSGQKTSRIYLDEKTAADQQKILFRILEERLGKKRIPMLIVDSAEVLRDRRIFSARGAGILGFSIVSSKRTYLLNSRMQIDWEGLEKFLEKYAGQPVLVFGFTYMIWKYFYEALRKSGKRISLEKAVMIHGGGWKKMQEQAVSAGQFRERILEVSGIHKIYNYYGMAEQTGCIYLECEYGHLHASSYSDIMIRRMENFAVCPEGEEGTIQVLSPMAASYPGHSILTEDRGILLGTDDCPCGRKGKYFKVTGRIPKAEIRGCSDVYDR